MGNITKARKLFDAATAADKKHVAAWHGWAFLEISQRNVNKARDLLRKGLEYCGPNEYIFQTLALLEVKAKRYKEARSLFVQATKCNPKSCASWLAWAQLEAEQDNNITARHLFEAWAILEERVGNVATARRLFRSSLNIDSQNYVTWMSLATLEENQGNSVRAEEIRNLYFQQRTEVVGDASWDVNLSDFFAPAINRIKGLLNFDQGHSSLGNGDPQKGSIQQCIGDNIPEIEALSNLTNEFSIKNENHFF